MSKYNDFKVKNKKWWVQTIEIVAFNMNLFIDKYESTTDVHSLNFMCS